jgi:hypothetical protein
MFASVMTFPLLRDYLSYWDAGAFEMGASFAARPLIVESAIEMAMANTKCKDLDPAIAIAVTSKT